MIDVNDLLRKTSRTFALAIPLLPEPTRKEVGLAYLLFRIADTFEDATLWPPARRIAALDRLVVVVDGDLAEAQRLADDCGLDAPVHNGGYRELLAKMPGVLREVAACRPEAAIQVRRHVRRSIEEMEAFVRRADARGSLALSTIEELRAYCYTVAGIVGEMLTELYLLGRPPLARAAEELRQRAAEFGEGLQLVNILKDERGDASEGRNYLPRDVPVREVLDLAARDLTRADEFVALLRGARAEPGLIAFNAFIRGLATANLRILEERGAGAKLTRAEVARIGAQVLDELGASPDGEGTPGSYVGGSQGAGS